MKNKQHEEEWEATIQEIARMHKDIAALAASVKKLAEDKISEPSATGEQGPPEGEERVVGEHLNEGWADLQQALEEARARGDKALKDLATEVERHPLRSIAAAIGFGFIIARLFGRGRNS